MKTFISLFLFLIISVITQGQYYISFSGSGQSRTVDSVQVTNLMSHQYLKLTGGEVLHLWDGTLGVKTLPANPDMEIYPNPMTDQSTLTFVVPESGIVDMRIFDITGKILYQTGTTLSCGKYTYSITGIKIGMYFIKIDGKNFNYSTKIISENSTQNQVNFERVSFEPLTFEKLKSLENNQDTVSMEYTTGDRLEYKGYSGVMSAIIMTVPTMSKIVTFNFIMCQDRDGHNYSTLTYVRSSGKSDIMSDTTSNDTIVWMAENMNVGTMITSPQTQTGFTKYCYDNDSTQCEIFGGLYQWGELMQFDTLGGGDSIVQGICPTNWHISTNYDWENLMNFQSDTSYLDSISGAGTLRDSTYWHLPLNGASNSTGFSALPGGVWSSQSPGNGYSGINTRSFFYTSTPFNNGYAMAYLLENFSAFLYLNIPQKKEALPVRCVKN